MIQSDIDRRSFCVLFIVRIYSFSVLQEQEQWMVLENGLV